MKAKDISNLYLFCQSVESGGFAAASLVTHVSAPTLSRAVSHLEEHVGEKLVHRNAKQFQLTTSGEEYYQRFAPIFGQLSEQWLELSNTQATLTGDIRISCPEPFADFFVQELAIEFMKQHPEVNISIHFLADTEHFVDKQIDLAIVTTPTRAEHLIQRNLLKSQLVLAASPQYIKQHGKPSRVEDLLNHKLLSSNKMTQWEFKQDGQWIKIPPSPRYSVISVRLIIQAALAGIGICLIPMESFNKYKENGELVALLPEAECPIGSSYLVWADRRLTSARVTAFKDMILERFNDPEEFLTSLS
ncbi:LysR family transcriptional regulator [Vibrio sp. ZSDE26]|uniref:LysR family transcriptional regulator n=1 Tax=Vibrio amylolyticus TaxID=2847292 RepID=A0A9X1XN31_9VIBR|nr:LysR family transcriptional regulator [Vibrio amylolyticus]MCK6265786.1 LysR family transcriptional regulator [Vibrio amylolyticus]